MSAHLDRYGAIVCTDKSIYSEWKTAKVSSSKSTCAHHIRI
jgi:hypothetical protein